MTRRDFIFAIGAFPFALRLDEPKAFVGEDVFARVLKAVSRGPIGATTAAVALQLQGTPYVGATLELSDDREFCSVNLLGLDCVTLYETSLCFARMLRDGGRTPQGLLREVTFTRYRGGKLHGYLSRLHYTSDWIYDNARKGVVNDLTPSLPGAERMDKTFDFMSSHPSLYRQLKAHPDWVPKLAELERAITARKPWYVPNDKVAAIEPLLGSGDIVGIATRAAGLDCSHTGLVYVDEAGTRRFLNASSLRKEVVLGERLSDYATKYKNNLGVMIARPL